MAEVAPAPAKVAKKKAPKPKKTGPSVGELIVKYVSASKERSGVSVAAIKKLLANGGYDVEKNNSRVKVAIKSLVAKEILTQVKGIGASGSFKMNKKRCASARYISWTSTSTRVHNADSLHSGEIQSFMSVSD
uniref:Histone H1 n=1 Tax=Labrus bergylta TaxID=56723 RepID=A0A3Q3G3S1_9LABR